MPRRHSLLLVLLICGATAVGVSFGQVANGFDLSGALIPVREIRGGGPPRDGIPALTDPPRVDAATAATWLEEDDRVMGVAINGTAVAYPISILSWHEIVNDRVGGQPVIISYCPLCGTGVVFEGWMAGQRLIVGVSGLLYNSDVLFYDRGTMSLFSQMMFQAVTGPLRGQKLQPLPATTTSWGAWRQRHPDTAVLSRALPYGRDYGTDPYGSYRRSGNTMFPVKGDDTSQPSKTWAYLILDGDDGLVVAEPTLSRALPGREPGRFRLSQGLTMEYDAEQRQLTAALPTGEEAVVIPGYWFALTAFHPQARILEADDLAP